jgi:predicted RNA-binding Zn-ribbon protein involved in translation (DUF1610 family)
MQGDDKGTKRQLKSRIELGSSEQVSNKKKKREHFIADVRPLMSPPGTAGTAIMDGNWLKRAPDQELNMLGAFPRDYLGEDEIVLFETKPTLITYFVRPVITFIILLIVGSIFFITSSMGDMLSSYVLILIGALLLSLFLNYLDWKSRTYALTNKYIYSVRSRISRISVQCTYDKVENITLRQGFFQRIFNYGEIAFWTGGGGGFTPLGWERKILGGGGIVWRGIRNPTKMKSLVMSCMQYFIDEKKLREFKILMATIASTPSVQNQSHASDTSGKGPSLIESDESYPWKLCPKCGKELVYGSAFCDKCGKSIV